MRLVDWDRFYTPKELAARILSTLPEDFTPEYAIDICMGGGNFLVEAFKKWENIHLIGVDLNPNLENISFISQKDIFKFDALDITRLDTVKKIVTGNKKIVLANPPFGNTTAIDIKKSEHNRLYKISRIESLMLISNLYLLEKGDYFGAILPENIFSAQNMKEFRDFFLNMFEVIHIGLPEQYFEQSEVKTRMFIGKYNPIKKHRSISQKLHSSISTTPIFRGIDNSKLLKEKDHRDTGATLTEKVIHSIDAKNYRYTYTNKHDKSKRIKKGDILVCRVGRNTGKVIYSCEEHYGKYISDHFFIIRKSNIRNVNLLEDILLQKKKGLTVEYISKTDILNAILELRS